MWLTRGHNQPDFRLTVDGIDVTAKLQSRLVGLTMTDNRGLEADDLTIELSDHDGRLPIPPLGGTARLWLGWKGQGLIDKGSFTMDEISWSGYPGRLSITARSANFRDALNAKKERSWHAKSLGDIMTTIAADAGIEVSIADDLAAIVINHIDQTDESDGAFLTRLARDHGAIVTVKSGVLLFFRPGQARTASGKPLEQIVIDIKDGDSPSYRIANRDAYNGVKASWQDKASGEKKTLTIRKDDCDSDNPAEGSPENIKVLRHVYASEEEARQAASGEWQAIQRGKAELSLTLALGRADLFPELPVRVVGIKPHIDAVDWIITKVSHSLTDGGFTTGLDLERVDAEGMEEA